MLTGFGLSWLRIASGPGGNAHTEPLEVERLEGGVVLEGLGQRRAGLRVTVAEEMRAASAREEPYPSPTL